MWSMRVVVNEFAHNITVGEESKRSKKPSLLTEIGYKLGCANW